MRVIFQGVYHENMARPRKEKKLLMNVPLRIMLTSDQKDMIARAAESEGLEVSAWARNLMIQAARSSLGEKSAIDRKRR